MDKKIGLKFKKLREKSGLTQRQIAVVTDISYSTIIKIERGARHPGASTLKALAKALGCKPKDILNVEDIP